MERSRIALRRFREGRNFPATTAAASLYRTEPTLTQYSQITVLPPQKNYLSTVVALSSLRHSNLCITALDTARFYLRLKNRVWQTRNKVMESLGFPPS